jgi:pyruvate/2-oxoglutarate dehydrogenase complex dihydrolipoamide acyltransferase (E2) component
LSVEEQEQEQEPPMSLGAVAARMGSAEKKVKVRATTDAKRLAADATINLRDVTATGADGRMVTKSDVEAFLAEQRRGGTTTAGKASRATAEMRVSKDDGVSYTRGEFMEFYGGTTEWDAAKGRTPRLQTK